MNKKIKQKRTLIVLLSVIIAFAIVTLVSDKEDTVKIWVLKKELDPEKPVSEQIGNFVDIEINKSDYEEMGSSFVTSLDTLKEEGLKITIPLTLNSPIPMSLIEYSKNGGELSNSLATYRTWYKLDNTSGLLPPGVSEGDKVDVGVLFTDDNNDNAATFGMLLYGIKIAQIGEGIVYFEVTQEEHSKLSVASKVGTFVLQLPGKKDTRNCIKLTAEQRETTDCYNDYDRPISLNSTNIVDILKNNTTGSNIEKIFEKNANLLVTEGELFDILRKKVEVQDTKFIEEKQNNKESDKEIEGVEGNSTEENAKNESDKDESNDVDNNEAEEAVSEDSGIGAFINANFGR